MAFVDALQTESNKTLSRTRNGALAYESSGKALLDFSFAVSALRGADASKVEKEFIRAFYENPRVAMKFLFYLRDVRGGLGERRIFRVCYKALMGIDSSIVKATLKLVPEYGRYDDLWVLLDTEMRKPIIEIVSEQLEEDEKNANQRIPFSLLAKWLPSNNTSSALTRRYADIFCKDLGLTPRQYRKKLSFLRGMLDVVERKMSANDWPDINYEAVPSKANLIYKDAFLRHDEERRRSYLESLKNGEVKINAGVLYPHEIVRKYYSSMYGFHSSVDDSLEELWKALPNLSVEDTLCIRDGSGSMASCYNDSGVRPLDVATAMAIYTSEHNSEAWKNKFITFSSKPKFVDLSNAKTLHDKILLCANESECSNTNIEATMMLVLNTAVHNNFSQEEMPSRLLIISDMQFDDSTRGSDWYGRDSFKSPSKTLFEEIGEAFNAYGYKMPKLVFWNVSGHLDKTVPIQENELGVILCSGFSVQLLNMVMSGQLDPYKALLDTINVPRYDAVDKALEGIL